MKSFRDLRLDRDRSDCARCDDELASRSLVSVELIGGHRFAVVHPPGPIHGSLSEGARHLTDMDRRGAATRADVVDPERFRFGGEGAHRARSEEHTSELQSQSNLVCRLLLEKKKGLR